MMDWRGERKPISERTPYPPGAVVLYKDDLGSVTLLVLEDESKHSLDERKVGDQLCLVLDAPEDEIWNDDVGQEVVWQFGFTNVKEERLL